MKIIIEIGPNSNDKIIDYKQHENLNDNFKSEIEKMENLLLLKNVTITNCNQYFIYTANNMILRFLIQHNQDVPNDLKNKNKLNPNTIKIIEINEKGERRIIQNEMGLIEKNYFNELMNYVMDDYYESLTYY